MRLVFLDLDIKIRDGIFQVSFFNKSDSFPFSVVRMSDTSRNVPSNIVYSAMGAESLRVARASTNAHSFSTEVKPLVTCMST